MSGAVNENREYDFLNEKVNENKKEIGIIKRDVSGIKVSMGKMETTQENIKEDVGEIKTGMIDLGKSINKVEDCVHKSSNKTLVWTISVLMAVLTIMMAVEFRGSFLGG